MLTRCCQSCCTWGDCLHGTDIEDGCCHACDMLALWCKRPAVSISQHYTLGMPVDCETCYTESFAEMPPVQALYRYYKSFYRCVFPDPAGGILSLLDNLPPSPCPDPACETGYDDCCDTNFNSFDCQCNGWFADGIGGLSTWRREQLWADDASKWFIESFCFANGSSLGGSASLGRLSGQLLAIVYFERWWKIAEDCGENKIVVPDCPGGECGEVPYQTDDLVPRWWIFACSGVPLYDFEIDDAVRFGVITAKDAELLRIDISMRVQPDQIVLKKMADAGYLQAHDWRAEQRQAYIDLDTRFPGAGYGACIQDVEDMHTLGPFRKRLTEPVVGTSVDPLMKKSHIVTESAALQADCFIPYPGSSSDQTDYDYWAERQWVYFRGAPGGWTWAGWNAPSDGDCLGLGLNEEDAILRGCGRNDQSCIEAFKGNPRPSPTCAPCTTINAALTPCNHCTGGCDDCGITAAVSCADDNTPVPTKCQNFTIVPSCEGIRFVYAEYRVKNEYTFNIGSGEFEQTHKYVCYQSVASYLTEVKRSVNSWDSAIPFQCRTESPALPAFHAWDEIEGGHVGHSGICNPLSAGDFSQYTNADLCAGGICYAEEFCPIPWPLTGERNNAAADTDCPPHSTTGQVACIGHTIDCP